MALSLDMFLLAPSSASAPYRTSAKRPGRTPLLLRQRFDLRLQFLKRHRALEHLAIDEEGRRCIDLEDLIGEFLVGGELVEQRLIFLAGLDGYLG
jgi:hypothetical protein